MTFSNRLKQYCFLVKGMLILLLSLPALAAENVYTLKDIQGVWWESCDDPVAAFYISGDTYGGDFLGTYIIKLSGNMIEFDHGLPEGHSINPNGVPQGYLILSANKQKLTLQHLENDGSAFDLYACE